MRSAVRLTLAVVILLSGVTLAPRGVAAEMSVEDEYVDARVLAEHVRHWEPGPQRTLFLSRFELIERDYLPRARRYAEVDATARRELAEHDRLAAGGPQWEARKQALLAAKADAATALEQSRRPLIEFQNIYRARESRRIAYAPGMTWDELVDARAMAYAVLGCDQTQGRTADGIPPRPLMTLYRGVGGKEWTWRREIGVLDAEVDAPRNVATIVCVREMEEIVGRYRAVRWHVALVRAADARVLATNVLHGAPPPDTATVSGTPIDAPSIRGTPPTPAALAEWIARRSTAPR